MKILIHYKVNKNKLTFNKIPSNIFKMLKINNNNNKTLTKI